MNGFVCPSAANCDVTITQVVPSSNAGTPELAIVVAICVAIVLVVMSIAIAWNTKR